MNWEKNIVRRTLEGAGEFSSVQFQILLMRIEQHPETVWRWHREREDFPRAIKLSPNCTRWKLSEVSAWEASKAGVAA